MAQCVKYKGTRRNGFLGGSVVVNLSANMGNVGLIPGWGRSHGEGNGNPLQYSCLENPMDRGAWWAIVHSVAERWTQLSGFTYHVKLCLNMLVAPPDVCTSPQTRMKV